MPDDKFRLPGSSYEQVVKIIRAYGVMRGAVGPADVSRAAAMNPSDVSRNNGFLVSSGIAAGGNQKELTDLGRELSAALDHGVEDEVARLWRRVIDETEFLRQLVSSIRIRNGMQQPALQAHIAYSAKQPSTGTSKTGALTVIDILKISGVIVDTDGKLAVTSAPDLDDQEIQLETLGSRSTQTPDDEQAPRPSTIVPVDVHAGPVQIRVNIDVTCSVDELPKVTEHLTELRRTLDRSYE